MRILRPTYPGAPGAAVALALAAILVAGCGGGGGATTGRIRERAFTVYTSLPREGLSARRADAVAAGERLALADAGGRVGGHRVRLVELDSSAAGADTWDPGAVEANARRAADDPSASAYIGELDFGASAISVPVTNGAGILQVSPEDGLTTLTVRDPEVPGEGPERYYPRGRRTFLRLVPADYLLGEAMVAWARENGARSVAILHDDRLFGRELAEEAGAAAAHAHLRVTVSAEARHGQVDYSDVARELAASPADAVLYTGLGGPSADRSLAAVHRAVPRARLYGSSGLAAGGANAGTPILTVDDALPADLYGRPARALLERLRTARGAPTSADALYGYEAMRVVLDALRAAGEDSGDRAAVVGAAMRGRDRQSVVGPFSLTRTGDVTPVRFAGYRDTGGGRSFLGLRGPGGPLHGRR